MRTEKLITKTDAIELLGISRGKFEKLELKPKEIKTNPYRKSELMYLYEATTIKNLIGSKEVEELKPKERKPKDWNVVFDKRYPSYSDAIGDACNALFNLNRYAKYRACQDSNRSEIYNLKSSLLKYLYLNDYATNISKHTTSKEYFNRYIGDYVQERDTYYVFSFDVQGVSYCWHQPEWQMEFFVSDSEVSAESPMPYIDTDKPMNIDRNKLKETKELIRWFVKRAV